ncbi:MAG: DUF1223 domain-containing protein [Acidobacteria bacterium]|nr:DUF1223 domain-containing protein [Acidobacteriota bacterium]
MLIVTFLIWSGPVAVLELFTSEGCSSCPPADELAAEIATEVRNGAHQVIVLSYHVDYWDRLGWTDRFASAKNTARQRNYVERLGLDSMFTPQAVINGTVSCVGSRSSEVRRALQTKPVRTFELIRESAGELRLDWELETGQTALVLYVSGPINSRVSAGENRGRNLRHDRIVLDWERLQGLTVKPSWPEGADSLVVMIESSHSIVAVSGWQR